MTYNVFGGTLSLTQSINQSLVQSSTAGHRPTVSVVNDNDNYYYYKRV